jgi:hypothetical protein
MHRTLLRMGEGERKSVLNTIAFYILVSEKIKRICLFLSVLAESFYGWSPEKKRAK